MNEKPTPPDPPLGVSQLTAIHKACQQFEAAWKAGKQPKVEDFLGNMPEPQRRQLRRELESIEAEYRGKSGKGAPTLDQFIERLSGSGLIEGAEVQAVLAGLPAEKRPKTAEDLARELFRQGKLTRFQAQAVYQGKTRGLVVGNYVVFDKLGQGGMGAVYKARHKLMDRVVALKMLPSSATKSPDSIRRFQQEVKAAARLTHPNIVTAYDADQAAGGHFLVMECVDGKDLASIVKQQGPLAPGAAVDCIVQAAQGLEYAHAAGVIHRDIKPANLLVDRNGTVKILDMGLARIDSAVGGADDGLTRGGQVLGTLDYMAPEQALDTHNADARSDLYSLGCTLHYLLTGRPPYGGDTVTKKILAHRGQPVPSLRALCADVPQSLDAVFRQMLAKNPDERQQTMGEVISQLQQCALTQAPPLAGASLGPGEDAESLSLWEGRVDTSSERVQVDAAGPPLPGQRFASVPGQGRGEGVLPLEEFALPLPGPRPKDKGTKRPVAGLLTQLSNRQIVLGAAAAGVALALLLLGAVLAVVSGKQRSGVEEGGSDVLAQGRTTVAEAPDTAKPNYDPKETPSKVPDKEGGDKDAGASAPPAKGEEPDPTEEVMLDAPVLLPEKTVESGQAAKPLVEPAPDPSVGNSRAADRAVRALLAVMNNADNPMGYAFPPTSRGKPERYVDVERRYSSKTVTRPVYELRYETVIVMKAVKEGSRTELKPVPERRVVGKKQVGTRDVEVLVLDPNGSIVRTEKRPVFGAGGLDLEPAGWLGNNAMALTALLRCGVTPEKEPVLEKLGDRLSRHIDAFGTPDSTWDLAWAIVAFAEYPNARYSGHLERLCGRLLCGQIAQGRGKGLWGPVCVSPTLLRQLCEELSSIPAAPPKSAPRPARKPGGGMPVNPNFAAQAKIELARERMFNAFKAVSMHASRFAKATQYETLKDEHNSYGNDVRLPGWPINLYREVTADLESTALAAYALRVYAEHLTLPATIDFPRGTSVATDFSTREALAGALVAVSRAQRNDGSWNEMVVWQPVDEFRNGTEGQFGPNVQPSEDLPSQSPPIATAEACAAMEDLLAALDHVQPAKKSRLKPHAAKGPKPANRAKPPKPIQLAAPAQYREQIAKGRQRLLALTAKASRNQLKGLAPDAHQTVDQEQASRRRRLSQRLGPAIDPVFGGLLDPYSLVCQLRLDHGAGPARRDDQDYLDAQTFVASTVGLQTAAGFWPATGQALHWTPSVRERAVFLTLHPAAKGQAGPLEGLAEDKAMPDARALNRALVAYRLDYSLTGPQRLAAVHMLHYLSGAMAPAVPEEGVRPAGADEAVPGDGPEAESSDDDSKEGRAGADPNPKSPNKTGTGTSRQAFSPGIGYYWLGASPRFVRA
jgi:hypothetical protein